MHVNRKVMRREEIELLVDQSDVLADVDIKEASKEAKIGWIRTLIVVAVWPLMKRVLLKKVNPKILELIDKIFGLN